MRLASTRGVYALRRSCTLLHRYMCRALPPETLEGTSSIHQRWRVGSQLPAWDRMVPHSCSATVLWGMCRIELDSGELEPGVYGASTLAAVSAFKRRAGLEDSPQCDQATW